MVGVMLWAYYRVPSASFGKPDRIYPTFIVTACRMEFLGC